MLYIGPYLFLGKYPVSLDNDFIELVDDDNIILIPKRRIFERDCFAVKGVQPLKNYKVALETDVFENYYKEFILMARGEIKNKLIEKAAAGEITLLQAVHELPFVEWGIIHA